MSSKRGMIGYMNMMQRMAIIVDIERPHVNPIGDSSGWSRGWIASVSGYEIFEQSDSWTEGHSMSYILGTEFEYFGS